MRVVLPRAGVEAFIAAHGLTPVPAAAYDSHRLALGVPDGSRDLIVDKSLLLESGFEELNGVSFTKGCFVGQELTARTKHRGLVKKRLMPVQVSGALPPPGTIVTRAGRDVGELRSGAGGLAMALLTLGAAGGLGRAAACRRCCRDPGATTLAGLVWQVRVKPQRSS